MRHFQQLKAHCDTAVIRIERSSIFGLNLAEERVGENISRLFKRHKGPMFYTKYQVESTVHYPLSFVVNFAPVGRKLIWSVVWQFEKCSLMVIAFGWKR